MNPGDDFLLALTDGGTFSSCARGFAVVQASTVTLATPVIEIPSVKAVNLTSGENLMMLKYVFGANATYYSPPLSLGKVRVPLSTMSGFDAVMFTAKQACK
jgi:hypothetical protein